MKATWKRLPVLLLALLFVCVLCLRLARINQGSRALLAQDGKVDASALGVPEGLYMLAGAWQHYDAVIEDPAELAALPYTLTGDLRYVRDVGQETFRLCLLAEGDLAITLDSSGMRLWINGERVEYGINQRIRFSDYAQEAEAYDIVISIPDTRFYVKRCFVLLLGTEEQLITLKTRLAVCYVSVAALLCLMLVQCLALYVRKPSERYLLYLLFRIAASFIFTANHGRFAGLSLPLGYPTVTFVNAVGIIFPYAVIRNLTGGKARAADACAVGSLLLLFLSLLFFKQQFRILCDVVNIGMLLLQIGILAKDYLLRHGGGGRGIWLLFGANFPLAYEIFTLCINNGYLPHGYVDVQWQPMYLFSWMFYYIVMDAIICLYFSEKFAERDVLYRSLEQKVEEQTRELRKVNVSLVASREETRNFMAGMIHNMQNPLFALGGYMELLQDELGAPTDTQAQYLALIDNKLAQVNKMVDDMFLVSRLDGDGIALHLSHFPAREMLMALAQEARLSPRGIAVEVECDPGLVVTADPMRLRQVLENLVSNALRHSRVQGHIRMMACNTAEGLVFRVEDDGEGIDPTLLPHIFERYVKGKNGSTGLGLYIVKSIVEQHGGTVRAESEKDAMTCFIVTLPCGE